jgi:hypothetical protein
LYLAGESYLSRKRYLYKDAGRFVQLACNARSYCFVISHLRLTAGCSNHRSLALEDRSKPLEGEEIENVRPGTTNWSAIGILVGPAECLRVEAVAIT